MNSIEKFLNHNLKYDLLNRFHYKTTKSLPKIKKIVLNFAFKTNDLTNLATSLLVLEIVSKQKAFFTTAKHSNVVLKIRKGNPVGCKVTLQKKYAISFIKKFLKEIVPKSKSISSHTYKILSKSFFSHSLSEIYYFQELHNKYYLFNNLNKLNVTFITDCGSKKELFFILKFLKFPVS
jgi:large subunit ribosomal protein L5